MAKEGGCVEKGILDIANSVESKKKAFPYLELDSMMLSQVVEVARRVSQNDINSTHIQNWVRRKYVPHPQKKKYNREQVANILLINDLRKILPLEAISRLLSFVNQDLLDSSDDRINPTTLYKYYGEIFERTRTDWLQSVQELEREVKGTLAEEDLNEEDREKVTTTLILLNLLARANLYKQVAEDWLKGLGREQREID